MKITKRWGEQHLSKAARKHAIRYGGYFCYEEDSQWAVAYWEIVTAPELREIAEAELIYWPQDRYPNVAALKDRLHKILSAWHADYLIAIEEDLDPEGYRHYRHFRLQLDRCPDLITHCTPVAGRPDRLKAHTADGSEYIVARSSIAERIVRESEVYVQVEDLTLLSEMVHPAVKITA